MYRCCSIKALLIVSLLEGSLSVAASFGVPRLSSSSLPPPPVHDHKLVILGISGGSHQEPQPDHDDTPATPSVSPRASQSASSDVNTNTIIRQTAGLGPNAPPPGFLRQTLPMFPWSKVPNYLTYIRCLAIPILVGIFYMPDMNIQSGFLFACASATDFVDGYLARRWDITSAFGAFLDPVADKLMVSTSLILLAGRHGSRVAIPAAIILAREIAVSALREWMAQRGQRDVVKVGFQGKLKTALTMVALTILLFVPTSGSGWLPRLYSPGLTLLYMCAFVTVTSGSMYFLAAAPLLFETQGN
jgi:CDP-diacylglycerol---glycerol-3-phosphate 3-phosphatidyltransferase